MGKTISLTEDELDWLSDNHDSVPFKDQAARFNVNVDTLKRILVREGIREFDGAKYQLPRDSDVETWVRPCLKCQDTTPRPKNHYLCKRCRADNGYEDHD